MDLTRYHPPILQRADIDPQVLATKWNRGDVVQRLRYRLYPSIDIDPLASYAGHNPEPRLETVNRLYRLGFRNNPTAYVEVAGPRGPDDGSYARQNITEHAIIPQIQGPLGLLPFGRVKRQIHIVTYDTATGVDLFAHEERSAWLQPLRHGLLNDANYRIGVRDLRDTWADTFHTPLGDREHVQWPVSS